MHLKDLGVEARVKSRPLTMLLQLVQNEILHILICVAEEGESPHFGHDPEA